MTQLARRPCMARGARASPVTVALPKVSFEKIKDEVSTQPSGVHDLQARSYGYNDFSDFRRPDHYIRHIEPLEIDLAKQVEYDMDEQDKEWLDAVNADRKKEQINKISYEVFEIIMDRLEKEWFDLTKNIPKQDFAMPSEDSTCAICDDSEGENSNAIVFCDGCNLAVHQDCYGVPYIPEGQWLCRKCTVSPENPVQCILCPNEGGAFKQTIHGEWVHLLCAIWVPETRVANEVFMEPITGIEKVSKQRWKLKCSICDYRGGACIQCAKTSCFTAFHATCARKEKFLLPMKTTQGSEPVTLTCYCERHLPKEQQDLRETALANEERRSQTTSPNAKLSSKSARAYAKTYKPGPPLVPSITVNRILTYIGKVAIRKKPEFVTLMCRYWSLKREARRGAPLLKRLHLEPWTANAAGKGQSREEKVMKLEQLQRLRLDLVNVRALADLARKRETRKLRQTDILHQIMSLALFPHEARLRLAFERIMAADRKEFFKNPVNKSEVPDYFDIVTNPMCWSTIDNKLDRHEYWDLKTFKDDIDLVVDNAILYNKPGTSFYKAATRIRNACKSILEELDSLSVVHPLPQPAADDPVDLAAVAGPSKDGETTMDVDVVGDAEDAPGPNQVKSPMPLLGDLEPPLEILDLLESSAAISADLNIELGDSPIVSLFNYELARVKPPPPPPPRAPGRPRKPKRDRKAEADRLKARKEAAAASGEAPPERLLLTDNIDDFRLPRTRRAAAAVAAFEAEAQGSSSPFDDDFSDVESPSAELGGRNRSRKRLSISSIPQASSPQVVNDVDNRGLFNMFHSGWVFHPDQRRGGRAPVDRQPLPPPRKRQRTDPGTSSRLSMVSTAASENQTLRSPPATPSEHLGDESMEVDIKHEGQEATVDMQLADVANKSMEITAQELDLPEKENIKVPDEPGEAQVEHIEAPTSVEAVKPLTTRSAKKAAAALVIEVLDTPATRRQKRLSKGKDAATKPLDGNAVAGPSRPTRIAAPSRKGRESKAQQLEENAEVESELSDLSEAGSDGREAERSRGKSKKRTQVNGASPSKSGVTSGRVRADGRPVRSNHKTEQLETGTLVWAKSHSFPWWPGVVYDEDDLEVPLNVLQECKKERLKRKTKIIIVQFFDKGNTWAYVPRDKILELGEDDELDQEMLANSGPRQKWKTANMRTQCRDAFRRALAEMETDADRREQDDAEEGSAG